MGHPPTQITHLIDKITECLILLLPVGCIGSNRRMTGYDELERIQQELVVPQDLPGGNEESYMKVISYDIWSPAQI